MCCNAFGACINSLFCFCKTDIDTKYNSALYNSDIKIAISTTDEISCLSYDLQYHQWHTVRPFKAFCADPNTVRSTDLHSTHNSNVIISIQQSFFLILEFVSWLRSFQSIVCVFVFCCFFWSNHISASMCSHTNIICPTPSEECWLLVKFLGAGGYHSYFTFITLCLQ